MEEFDAIVIGTGQAGPSLASKFAGEGHKTAIIEKDRFGGTCVNTGCTPTKTLVASARSAHMARRSSDFGVNISGEVTVDMKAVKARKDKLVNQSTTGVENWLKNTANLTVYEGHARFESANTVRVGNQLLKSDKIFINVGGKAYVPDGFADIPYLTNVEMMEVDFVPEHLVVIGGSYIGLEFGQMYARFGSKVTIVEMGSRLLKREDEDVSAEVLNILEAENINVRLNSECIRGSMDGEQIVIHIDCAEEDKTIRPSHVLIATGRTPNTFDLGLENTEVQTNTRGYITVNDQLETTVPGIWALGDCNGTGAFTHTAYNDFEIVAANLLENDPRRVSDRLPCYGLFIERHGLRSGSLQKARL